MILEKCKQDLADLYAILAYFKWDDLIYTHASIRLPKTTRFLINQFGLRFDEVTPDNLVVVDSRNNDLELVNPAGHNIHSTIYKARPDVNCVIHTHTKEGIAVSASRLGLLPISQYSVGVMKSLAYHDYNGLEVDPDGTLRKDMDNKNHIILRNHGLLTVGNDVVNAFFNMYNLQKACEVQVLTPADCVLIKEEVLSTAQEKVKIFNSPQPHRPLAWDAIKRLANRV